MLIRFLVSNLFSFNQETEFNMLTGDIRRFPDHVYNHPKVDVLKTAVIYGANGAGKSNLIFAIDIFVDMITHGGSDLFSYLPIFKLAESQEKPVKFEIEFISSGIGYGYGLTLLKGVVQEEWLNKLNFGAKEDSLIFRRIAGKKGRSKIIISPKYQKTAKDKVLIQVYEDEILEEDQFFLTLAHNKRYSEITKAFNYISSGIIVINGSNSYNAIVSSFMDNPDFKEFTNKHICNFDTGVGNIDIEIINFDSYFGEDNISEKENVLRIIQGGRSHPVGESRNAIAMLEDGKPIIKKIVTYHTSTITGKPVKFELSEESDGTLRLLEFLPILYMLENFSVTIIIDEMDESIHPALLKEFIAKLQLNGSRIGQLIFTTHESNLLDLNIFRPDEIWFAEKDKTGATQFYPLSDYNIRQDLDIRKGYLSGRFGAIPFLSDLKKLNWNTDGGEQK